ncbi:MAG: PAS domain S-box protein [Nitrospinae bacterium]|nr:PAS domain S-box protein [Nitrospinota bacterium]
MIRGFGWKIFGAFAILVISLVIALSAIHSKDRQNQRAAEVQNIFRPLAASFQAEMPLTGDDPLPRLRALGRMVEVEAAFVRPGGESFATYRSEGEARQDFAALPEVAAALRGEEAVEFRFSNLLKKDAYFIAYPLRAGDAPAGALHFMVDPERMAGAGGGTAVKATAFTAIALAAAGLLSYLMARSLRRRVRTISDYLEAGAGDAAPAHAPRVFGDDFDRIGAKAGAVAGQAAETAAMLREERERVRAIIEYMEDGVLLLDADGNILLHNAAFLALFGLPQRTLDGKPIAETVRNPALLDLLALHRSTHKTVKREIALGVPPTRHLLASAAPLKRESPALRDIPVRIVAERDAGSARTLLMIYDVTQQKKLEEMRVDFVANASHELRTPLTAISGYVETMVDGAVDEPETARHMLGIIQRQTGRLGRLIDDLLALSNIELEKEKFEFLPMRAEPLIKNAAQMFAQAAANQGVTLDWTVEDGTAPFEADKDRLMQVFVNLLDNAIKYTPAGGKVTARCRTLTVDRHSAAAFDYPSLDGNPLLPETEEEWSRRFVEWFVTDTGEGIPAHAIPRLMERFFRVDRDRSRERGGTGLGLSIVKHIIIAHRGGIKVESEPGKGTTVRFVIPLSRKIP